MFGFSHRNWELIQCHIDAFEWRFKIGKLNREYLANFYYDGLYDMIRQKGKNLRTVGLWNYRANMLPEVIYRNHKDDNGIWIYEPTMAVLSKNH